MEEHQGETVSHTPVGNRRLASPVDGPAVTRSFAFPPHQIDWLRGQGNQSKYIRELIDLDIQQRSTDPSIDLKPIVEFESKTIKAMRVLQSGPEQQIARGGWGGS